MLKILARIISMFILIFLSGCSSLGGTYKGETDVENVNVNKEPIAINVINMINLPPVYSSHIGNVIKTTLNEKNTFIPMKLSLSTDPSFKNYLLASTSSDEKIAFTSNSAANRYILDRTIELKIAEAFRLMQADGEYLEKYPYSVLIKLKNTTEYKNFAAAMLSAVTVMAVPLVKEHTLMIDAEYYYKTKKIGQYSEKLEYDYSYSWNVDKHQNLHTMYLQSLLENMLNDLKNTIIEPN